MGEPTMREIITLAWHASKTALVAGNAASLAGEALASSVNVDAAISRLQVAAQYLEKVREQEMAAKKAS